MLLTCSRSPRVPLQLPEGCFLSKLSLHQMVHSGSLVFVLFFLSLFEVIIQLRDDIL